jgi:phospholipid-binding lipoprotein MlaA
MTMRGWIGALFGLTLAGCASIPEGATRDPNDPFESTNRVLFDASLAIDKAFSKPIAIAYRGILPMPVRDSIRNFLNNLSTVPVFANDILQGEVERAGVTLARGFVNTTFGIAGLFDVAEKTGMPRHYEDFGQTLAVWGVGEGPYLVIPFIGPANVRDVTGRVVDLFIDPFTYVQWGNEETYIPWVRVAVDNVDLRARNIETLDEIENSSADFYVAVRNLYRLARDNEIRNGEAEVQDLPDF